MSDERLLKCPFCGGEAKMVESLIGGGFFVACINCGATTLTFYLDDKINKATEAWNNRKPVENVLERLEEMRSKPTELAYDVPLIDSIIEIIKGELS